MSDGSKPVILLFTPFYLPGFRGGGPIQTVANVVDRLGDDFDFRIITSDRDLNDKVSYPGIAVDAWTPVGKALVYYASPGSLNPYRLSKLMKSVGYDALYLNSCFSYKFTLLPLLLVYLRLVSGGAVLVAPRGELSTGALNIKSTKKRFFLFVAKLLGFYRNCYWQASTRFEAEDILRIFIRNGSRISIAPNVAIAPDLVAKRPAPPTRCLGAADELRVVFLSRVVPMKNLDYVLKVLRSVRANVVFDVYGPKEDAEYWRECSRLIADLPKNIQFSYRGAVGHSEVSEVLRNYHLFFVPSRGENFGHVFVEALSAGVPILVSDRTPWRNLSSAGVGWDIPLGEMESFVAAIEDAAGYDEAVRHQMRESCLRYAADLMGSDEGIKMNVEMFNRVLYGRNSL